MLKKVKPWTTLSSKIVHQNPWYNLRHDKFVLPNGKEGNYFLIDIKASVFIIPVINGSIIFGKQFRYTTKRWSIEIPGGGVREVKNILKTAKLELREEVGYTGKFKKIGKFYPYNGIGRELCHVYLADNLKFVGQKLEETEKIKELKIPIMKAYQMIDKGKISDGMTISSLALARKYLIKKV